MSANIRLMPRGNGIEPTLIIPVPALEVVTTTLTLGQDTKDLPTLSSVEHIIGRLAGVGLVLADTREGDQIAHLINKRFLPVPKDEWTDQDLQLQVQKADGEGAPKVLKAVGTIRAPVLRATGAALAAGGAYDLTQRRQNEVRLVDEMSSAIIGRRTVWQQYGATAAVIVGKTVLDPLLRQLIGIPITDFIRSTLKGARRVI